MSLFDPGVLRAVVGVGLYGAVLGVFAIAVGAMVRPTAAAITGIIGFVLVLSPLAQLLPGSAGRNVHAYLPTVAGQQVATTSPASQGLPAPWLGFGIFCFRTTVLLLLAAVQLKRRDA